MTIDRAKRLAQLRQAFERGILDKDTFQAAVGALGAGATMAAEQEGGGAIAQDHSVAASEGGVSVGRDVLGSIYHIYQTAPGRSRLSEAEFERVLNDYLGWVLREHSRARLHGLQSLQGTGPLSKPLSEVYVSLVARPHPAVAPGDPRGRPRRSLAISLGEDSQEWEHSELVEPRPVDMADLLTLGDRVAIVGGAGCGKTTFLSFVAASLAAALAGHDLDTRLKPRQPGAPLPIPLFAPLRFWNRYRDACLVRRDRIIDDPDAGTLAGFLLWFLRYRYKNFEAASDFFERLLKGRGCLIMLDGLDEVVSPAERRVVRDAVGRLLDNQYPGTDCLVTAREAGYRDAPFGNDFLRCDVQPMTEDQIATLVEAWCAQIWQQESDCDTASRELLEAITTLNKGRARRGQEPLIATPLLVTMVVSVKYSRRELPRERAKLYDACVDVVLESQYTGYEDEAGARRAVVDWGGPPDKQREWLSQLAFEMHQGGAAGATADEDQVRAVLEPLLSQRGEQPLLGRFMAAVRGRGGLFEERGEQYQFMHLTFQEFLAAQHLARQWAVLPNRDQFLAEAAADEWWREALLLTVGSLGAPAPYEQREAFVTLLCDLPGSPEAQFAAAELCTTGLLDLTEPEPALLEVSRDRLVALLEDDFLLHEVPPPRRAAAGDALAHLGDPRPGVGLREDGLPDIAWCEVPAGPFLMGSDKDGDPQAYSDEYPQHEVVVPRFAIAKYPVTVAQYAAFVEAGGYGERRYWTGAGWQWKGERAGPDTYGGAFDLANHPVVGVSWYEAVAFCRWLTERLHRVGDLGPEEEVRLPAEAEWEKAARGMDGRIYPWGDAFDPQKCNMGETGIGTTSAVGIFPGETLPYGVQELSGNVWEWCATKWRNSYGEPADESPEGNAHRVLRGGSFYFVQGLVRCAARFNFSPYDRGTNYGFRCVVAPVASEH